MGVSGRIVFLGSLSEEKKFQYLSISDVYILSSIHEGFGIVLQEAMQVGLPVITTNNGGQVDFVEEGKNGFLLVFGDEDKMVDKIQQFYLDEELKIKFSNYNKKAVEKFEVKKICEEYTKVL